MAQQDRDEKDIPILVLSTDRHYALPLTVTIFSALKNHRHNGMLKVFVLDSGLGTELRAKIERLLAGLIYPIEWVEINDAIFKDLPVRHYTIATYNRLLIPHVLPTTISKVIYLDCDLLVEGDIYDLWKEDPGDAYLMAVQEQELYIANSVITRDPTLSYDADDRYFSAGVLVMNLDQFRRRQLAEKALDFIRKNTSIIRNADQDGLNAVCIKNWIQLDPKWNQPAKPAKRARFERMGGIVHFSTRRKPWLAKEARVYRNGSAGVYRAYQRYLRASGWFSDFDWFRYSAERNFYKIANLFK